MFHLQRPKYHSNADFTIAERESKATHTNYVIQIK